MYSEYKGKVYFVLDRALVEYLGIRGYGVHLVAYVKENKKIKIWTLKELKISGSSLTNWIIR